MKNIVKRQMRSIVKGQAALADIARQWPPLSIKAVINGRLFVKVNIVAGITGRTP